VRALRAAVQLVFMGGVVALMARGLAGLTPNTCEYYCPFGGLVSLYPLARYKAYTCALTELNVSLLVSLVVLTVATKKSFCSWICPLGTVQEWIGRVGRRLLGRRFHLPAAPDRALMILRYVVLALVVALTYTIWQFDLGFRAYDPFYVLFTGGVGHGTAGALSVVILAGFLAAALFVPFLWCRYACPLGATIDPLSRAGALRIRRNRDRCTECGSCDAICPHRIPVSQVTEVTARNCTNCLECVEGCPESGALELSWFGK
jgi:polyferredoxin